MNKIDEVLGKLECGEVSADWATVEICHQILKDSLLMALFKNNRIEN